MKEATKEKSCELLSDEQIIDLYFAREERAIKETDHKYGKYLFTIAYNIVQDTLDCEECLNDTYLNTWNRIPPTRPSIFHAFLSKIMRNIAVDRYRHNKAQKRALSRSVNTLKNYKNSLAHFSHLLNDISPLQSSLSLPSESITRSAPESSIALTVAVSLCPFSINTTLSPRTIERAL